ncbi:N-acetylmuramoyl-L-alanine amidase-like domain-containing protein [Mycoplasma hafezii]|uniref:N-acetylmuramoyl-L-alanine amidase-like domain-containing protein n=1 Tax=Mycoplasma hafezii TaxID=525886 RepID=UPI003CE9E4A5
MKLKKLLYLSSVISPIMLAPLFTSCVQSEEKQKEDKLKNEFLQAYKKYVLEHYKSQTANFEKWSNSEVQAYKKAHQYEVKDFVGFNNQKRYLITNSGSQEMINKINEAKKTDKYSSLKTTAEKVTFISSQFMNQPYYANRMFGSKDLQEEFVVLLNELDCFTYLDYINAFLLDQTNTTEGFYQSLIQTRYNHSSINYVNRKHFFTDWAYGQKPSDGQLGTIKIVTDLVKPSDSLPVKDIITVEFVKNGQIQYEMKDKLDDKGNVVKNDKGEPVKVKTDKKLTDGNGNVLRKDVLPGVAQEPRSVSYIRWDAVTDELMKQFKTGDLIMLAASGSINDWLDVTHCGLLINGEDGKAYYRNASSQSTNMKVVDSNLVEYLKYRNTDKEGKLKAKPSVPGILVYRIDDPNQQEDSAK